MTLWVSVPVLLLEVACIVGLHWSDRDRTDPRRLRVGTTCCAVAVVGILLLGLAWWRGW